ncbi:unnamed protein product [Amaranthus hypochondriacus]
MSCDKMNMPGGWFPVDPNSENVKKIASWAVDQYNKEIVGVLLKFENAYKAEEQVVNGKNYRICLNASVSIPGSCGSSQKKYEAIVYQAASPCIAPKLVSFKELPQHNQCVLVAN